MSNSAQPSERYDHTGELTSDLANPIADGFSIAVLPISRVHIEWDPIEYEHGIIFYPPGFLNLGALNVLPNQTTRGNHAELASAYSEHRESRIVGSSIFSHAMVMGLGLPLETVATEHFPKDGEVGIVLRHGLDLFAAALETSTPSLKFVQTA